MIFAKRLLLLIVLFIYASLFEARPSFADWIQFSGNDPHPLGQLFEYRDGDWSSLPELRVLGNTKWERFESPKIRYEVRVKNGRMTVSVTIIESRRSLEPFGLLSAALPDEGTTEGYLKAIEQGGALRWTWLCQGDPENLAHWDGVSHSHTSPHIAGFQELLVQAYQACVPLGRYEDTQIEDFLDKWSHEAEAYVQSYLLNPHPQDQLGWVETVSKVNRYRVYEPVDPSTIPADLLKRISDLEGKGLTVYWTRFASPTRVLVLPKFDLLSLFPRPDQIFSLEVGEFQQALRNSLSRAEVYFWNQVLKEKFLEFGLYGEDEAPRVVSEILNHVNPNQMSLMREVLRYFTIQKREVPPKK